MIEDLRGVFFIIKGQYRKDLSPQWYNPVSESVNWCGGYDPSRPDTVEWYQLLDTLTYTVHRAGSDLDTVLQGVEHIITKYKSREGLERAIKSVSFGVSSKSVKALDGHLCELYGDFFAPLIREREERAYAYLKDHNPVVKARKLKRRVVNVTQQEKTSVKTPTPSTSKLVSSIPRKKNKLVPKKRQLT